MFSCVLCGREKNLAEEGKKLPRHSTDYTESSPGWFRVIRGIRGCFLTTGGFTAHIPTWVESAGDRNVRSAQHFYKTLLPVPWPVPGIACAAISSRALARK